MLNYSHWILKKDLFFNEFSLFSNHKLSLRMKKDRLSDKIVYSYCTGSSIYIGPLVQFSKFLSPFQKNFKTNDTSIESTNKEILDSLKKLGVASSWGWSCSLNWKSITFTKTSLEPSMIEILPVSKLFSFTTIHSFLLRYITLS